MACAVHSYSQSKAAAHIQQHRYLQLPDANVKVQYKVHVCVHAVEWLVLGLGTKRVAKMITPAVSLIFVSTNAPI